MNYILYIEAIDMNSLFGSGGGPMLRYSSKMSKQFVYITFTSKKEVLFKINTVVIDNEVFKYIPISRLIKHPLLKSIIPLNLYFLLILVFNFNKIKKIINSNNIVTKTYSVLWYFTLLKKGMNVCYVLPGLENPFQIGRFSKLSKYFIKSFNYINDMAISRADTVFVAGTLKKIHLKNLSLQGKNIKKQIIKIPQVVDTSLFYGKDRNDCKIAIGINTKYIFSFLGRLSNVKGIDLIIDSFIKFNSIEPDSTLIIIGEGEEIRNIKKKITETDLINKIHLVGKKSPPDLINYICASNAGIFASHAEGFSNAMLEFLACGIPIISTVVGGTDELIIEGVTGYSILSREPEDFCLAMSKIINIDLGKSCLKHVSDNYELIRQWKIIANNWKPLCLK